MNPLLLPARNRGIYVGVILVTLCLSVTLVAIVPRAGDGRVALLVLISLFGPLLWFYIDSKIAIRRSSPISPGRVEVIRSYFHGDIQEY
jgi:hypothetical protein